MRSLILHLVVMQLHALSFQPPSAHCAHCAKAKTTSQKLQPDRGEQGGGLEGTAGSICIPGLAALLLHTRDQQHDLVESFKSQLEIQHINTTRNIQSYTLTLYSFFWLLDYQ